MAVYTPVEEDHLEEFLRSYNIGEIVSFIGIVEGVSNSNFLLETDQGRFILTLFEELVELDSIPYFLSLMSHLSNHGIVCPMPVENRNGLVVGSISSRPAVIVTFISGRSLKRYTASHCHQVGQTLADFHNIGADFKQARPNSIGLAGFQKLFASIKTRADGFFPDLSDTIEKELNYLQQFWPHELPQGAIHGDLFPDNVFFQKDSLSGIIDFHYACTDLYVYDLSICLNAWCFEAPNDFNVTKARALVAGYESKRKLDNAEKEFLPFMLRASATRFLVRRLYDWLNVSEGALVKPHDPFVYLRRLSHHQQMETVAAYGF